MANESSAKGKKPLILNAFVMMCRFSYAQIRIQIADLIIGSGHQSPGLWRHPDDKSWKFDETEHWVELAKLLESAKFHGIFIADVLGKFFNEDKIAKVNPCRWLRCVYKVFGASNHLRRAVASDRAPCSCSRHGRCHEEYRLRGDHFHHIRAAIPFS